VARLLFRRDVASRWRLAEPLTALNHAISYVSIWSDVDAEAADREFGSATRRWLQWLVAALRGND
jgi:hypothetical protein